MMRKEIAFMKAKGAPAKMIKHEEAEGGGYARGGVTRSKKEVRDDQRTLGAMAVYKKGGRVKRMANGGPTPAAPQQANPAMTQGAMPHPGTGGFAGQGRMQGMQGGMRDYMRGMQGRMQGMPQGSGQFQGQMNGMQGGMQNQGQMNGMQRGMQNQNITQLTPPPNPQTSPPNPQTSPPNPQAMKKGGIVKKMAKGGMLPEPKGGMMPEPKGGMMPEPKGGMQKFVGGQRELAVGNRPHGEHVIQEKGKTRGKPLQPEGNVGITSMMKKGGTVKKYAAGGSVGSASRRADGCATKGKTKGRYI